MKADINSRPPLIMHIDLNSAFAMTEQQANPLLRGRPVGITNRINKWSICITASYEAKRMGIGIGTRYEDAKRICPDFVMLESDPAKYQYIHRRLLSMFQEYSPTAYMKSIDEGIIDFSGMEELLGGRSMQDIGYEIKRRIRDEIGDWMTVNVGIGQNRWLAKVAASFMKPDGLYVIDRNNIEVVYGMMNLTDLPYIKARNQLRLNMAGIYTPLEFLRAPEWVLTKEVFQSINGHHWYLKLRGYETEVEYGIKTVGRSYVLEHRTNDPEELATLLHKFSGKVARRLRKNNLAARGLSLGLRYAQSHDHYTAGDNSRHGWFLRHMFKTPVWRADQIFARAQWLFAQSPPDMTVSAIVMTSYALSPATTDQPYLWETEDARMDRVEQAINEVNDRYGELVVQPASVLASHNPMKDKIPFGTIRYFDS
jgi:DNA polymerase-4